MSMIFEGFKLSAIGMLVVFSFLVLLVLVVVVFTEILKPYTQQEARELERLTRARSLRSRSPMDRSRLVAVISAAISAHRDRMRGFEG